MKNIRLSRLYKVRSFKLIALLVPCVVLISILGWGVYNQLTGDYVTGIFVTEACEKKKLKGDDSPPERILYATVQ